MLLSRSESVIALALLLLGLSCRKAPSAEDLEWLNGYWEIREVVFPDGGSKEYKASSTVEYFHWKEDKGYRKKVQPTVQGTYLTSDDALPMEITWREGRLFLAFSGEGQRWEEEVRQLDRETLVTLHQNGLRYEYTRYKPLITTP
jgi:hypothetical protein